MYSVNSEQMDYLESLLNFDIPLIPGVPLEQSQLDAIASNTQTAYYFARYVVDGKWAQGERAISRDSRTAFYYALVCLDARFELGEFMIDQNLQYKHRYSRLKRRWSKMT